MVNARRKGHVFNIGQSTREYHNKITYPIHSAQRKKKEKKKKKERKKKQNKTKNDSSINNNYFSPSSYFEVVS